MSAGAEMHAFQGRIATDHPFDFRGLTENGCVIPHAQAHLVMGRSTSPGTHRPNAPSEAGDQLILHVLNFLRPIFRAHSQRTSCPVSQLFSLYFRAVVIVSYDP